MPRRELLNVFFFVFLIWVLGMILWVLAPFGGALLGAVVVAVTMHPMYNRLCGWVPRCSTNMRALLMTFLVLLFLVVPIAVVSWTLVSESESLATLAHSWSQMIAQWKTGEIVNDVPWIRSLRYWMYRTLGVGPRQFQQNVMASLTGVLGFASEIGRSVAQHAITFIFQTLLMLFTLFFLLRDGTKIVAKLESVFPMRTDDTREVFETVHDTVVGVVRGWFLTSIVQAFAATVGFFIVGLDGALVFGVLTGIIGLLPVIGTFGVWVPIGIYFFVHGAFWKGMFVFVWGALVVVGLIDTVVRPYLVGQRAEMPLLTLFFALLGGAEVMGAKGIVLGPIFFALAPVLLNIYRRRYLYPAQHPEVAPPPPA